MANYRVIESAPENGERYGKAVRTTIFCGPDRDAMKRAISDYYQQPRKPYAELSYYYGQKRIFAYEL